MKGTDYILQTLFNYLQTTELKVALEGRIYKFKRPLSTKNATSAKPVCVLNVVTGTSNTIQVFRCNVNIYVPSLCVDKTYYPDSSTLASLEELCLQVLDSVTYEDCLIKFADAPYITECSESNEWLLNCSLNISYK